MIFPAVISAGEKPINYADRKAAAPASHQYRFSAARQALCMRVIQAVR
jgi:hypothetical protein